MSSMSALSFQNDDKTKTGLAQNQEQARSHL